MNTSRRSISKLSKAVGAGVLGLSLLVCGAATAPGDSQKPAGAQRELPPFLDVFRAVKQSPVRSRQVTLVSAVGRVTGILSRPETDERLPALLLVPGDEGLNDWMKQSSRELASIGYVTLLVEPVKAENAGDERMLARLSAAVRWLRRRPDVFPEAIGVAGWSEGAGPALTLAGSMPLQACVVCDGPMTDDAAVLAGLRGTPVLGVFAGRDDRTGRALPGFRKILAAARVPHKINVYAGVQSGFMNPANAKSYAEEEAERAWVEVYEFLGKHVEDAPFRPAVLGSSANEKAARPVATVADIMRAVNDASGVRGALLQSLEKQPGDVKEWRRVRARAALLAEAGRLLQDRTPRRGSAANWGQNARNYEKVALAVVAAADQQDYAAARSTLTQLTATCTACHQQHR